MDYPHSMGIGMPSRSLPPLSRSLRKVFCGFGTANVVVWGLCRFGVLIQIPFALYFHHLFYDVAHSALAAENR